MPKPDQFDHLANQLDPTAALAATLDGLPATLERIADTIADAAGGPLLSSLDTVGQPAGGPGRFGGIATTDTDTRDAILSERRNAGRAEYNADGTRRAFAPGAPPTMRRRISPKRTFRRLLRERAAKEQIEKLPTDGEEIIMLLAGHWHGFDLVGAVVDLAGQPVKHLRLATLGFNRSQARRLADLMDAGHVLQCTMLVSEVFEAKQHAEFGLLKTLVEARGGVIRVCRNHCKLLLFDFGRGRKYAAHGSLNLRSCVAYEQMALSKHTATHDFFADYVDTIGQGHG